MSINKRTKEAFWNLYDEIYHMGMLEYESIVESYIVNAVGDGILTENEAHVFQQILDESQCIYEERFYSKEGNE